MDPTQLIGPASPLGLPAPFWFVELFKILGFSLHMVPMNLWYAGLVLVALLHLSGGKHAKRMVARLMKQMPIVVALGINLGIVPLLFTQVAYYRAFYPATILMAWPWFAVVPLLIVAYYGVYLYSYGLRDDGARMSPLKRAAGWVSALLFVVLGFLFANAFSLMTNVGAWPSIWQSTSVAGAPLGIALNLADPTLWPRWLLMFGLALTTTATWVVVDAAFFAGGETPDYRAWAPGLALKVYTVGLLWYALAGLWYVFGAWPEVARQTMLGGPLALLTIATAGAPALPWLLVLVQKRGGVTRGLALAAGLAQFVALGLNAVSRQVVQNAELGRFLDVSAEPVNTQWSPLIVFLVLFVAGLATIAWMVTRVVAATRKPSGIGL